MPGTHIRSRDGGKSFQLRVKHKLLDAPLYRTFYDRGEAERAEQRALEDLKRGEVPSWLKANDEKLYPTIAAAVRGYLNTCAVPESTKAVLDTIIAEIGSTDLDRVKYPWAEEWIRELKITSRITPGTIRKKKGALSRALDWLVEYHPTALSSNPLPRLPHGYSAYNDRIREELEALGVDAPDDIERDRRVDPEEEGRIVAELDRRAAAAVDVAERAQWEGMSLMFQLGVRTAMRMREIYTLTVDQIDLPGKTIRLERTKNGDRRAVPIGPRAMPLLTRAWEALEAVRLEGRVFPFWDGSLDKKRLAETTSDLSRRFSRVFRAVGSDDLRFHDTRHEAVCRWVLEAPQPLSSEFLARAAGMKDARTRQRYLSLRGSELAAMLG
jgi:integrase